MAKQSTQRQKQCNDDKELLRKKKKCYGAMITYV